MVIKHGGLLDAKLSAARFLLISTREVDSCIFACILSQVWPFFLAAYTLAVYKILFYFSNQRKAFVYLLCFILLFCLGTRKITSFLLKNVCISSICCYMVVVQSPRWCKR